MNQEINIAPNTDVLSLIGLGNRPSVAGATLFTEMKMIEDLGMQYATPNSKRKTHFAIYECPYCGKHFRACIIDVKRQYKSCGCMRLFFNSESHKKHGLCAKDIRLFGIWHKMMDRCYNDKLRFFNRYGGRGIVVCDEWKNPKMFFDWALNNGYTGSLCIDRINNDGNYDPNNCRWVTKTVSSQNRNMSIVNTSGYIGVDLRATGKWRARITVNGKRMHLGDFNTAKEAALAYNDGIYKYKTQHITNKID